MICCVETIKDMEKQLNGMKKILGGDGAYVKYDCNLTTNDYLAFIITGYKVDKETNDTTLLDSGVVYLRQYAISKRVFKRMLKQFNHFKVARTYINQADGNRVIISASSVKKGDMKLGVLDILNEKNLKFYYCNKFVTIVNIDTKEECEIELK